MHILDNSTHDTGLLRLFQRFYDKIITANPRNVLLLECLDHLADGKGFRSNPKWLSHFGDVLSPKNLLRLPFCIILFSFQFFLS